MAECTHRNKLDKFVGPERITSRRLQERFGTPRTQYAVTYHAFDVIQWLGASTAIARQITGPERITTERLQERSGSPRKQYAVNYNAYDVIQWLGASTAISSPNYRTRAYYN